jgi:hypothetical protein
MKRTILLGLLVVALATGSAAHGAPPKAFVCNFVESYFGEIDNERLVTGKATDSMQLTFAGIDIKRKAAQLIGNAGASDVTLLRGDNSFHFVESTATGNMAITTVFHPTKGGKIFAVHSRHMNLSGPIVSQYYGWCDARS